MKKLLIGTHNPAKLAELRALLGELPVELVSLTDVGIDEDVIEDGTTYEENSQKKALFYAQQSGLPSISDDGGLEIAALDNKPGIHSKRWLGEETTEGDLIKHMKKVAKELPDDNRHARFVAVLSFSLPDGRVWSARGEVTGIIAKVPMIRAVMGFPYRSFFFLPELNKYYFETELTPDEQREYNHRVKAVTELKSILQRELL
jgi:XTP/dITP diphosphohydrolase